MSRIYPKHLLKRTPLPGEDFRRKTREFYAISGERRVYGVDFRVIICAEDLEWLRGEQTHEGSLILSHVGSLSALSDLVWVKQGLYITETSALADLRGLERLTEISGNLMIFRNNRLKSLRGLENLSRVGGRIRIWGNPRLESLEGLPPHLHDRVAA